MTSIDQAGCVTFRFYRPDVSSVKVLGTFNGWCGDSLRMSCDESGWWSVTAELPAGEYRFRYLADDKWFSDFAANGVEMRKDAWNSVLLVPEAAVRSIGIEREIEDQSERDEVSLAA